ncbi:MAG: hypothetical protein DYG89_02930 [Caldilinea sp. CFX5]|nr:hypothetical protein [Caldilinea sp. CFX5]
MSNAAVQLRAYNGQWVCAEGGGGRELVANRGIPSTWETFSMIPIQGGTLQDGSLVALQAFNGQYVCAEKGGGGIVVANRSARREWETFTLHRVAGAGELQNSDKIGLQAFNGQYLCAEGGGGRQIVANRSEQREWETFTIAKFAPRHLHIEIDSVYCADTEDVTGADSFFAIGAGADRFSGKSNTLLSIPFQINNGQTKSFPAETTQRVLFDGDVDAASTIVLGIMFYDEDANHDWSKYGPLITAISSGISSGLSQLGPYGIAGGVVLTVATAATGLIMTLDKDDLLGQTSLELPVLWQPIGTNIRQIGARGGGGWYSSWNYLINLKITAN